MAVSEVASMREELQELEPMARLREEDALTRGSRQTYAERRRRLDMKTEDPEIFIKSVRQALHGLDPYSTAPIDKDAEKIPLGSALPLRAAALRHLIDHFGWTEAQAQEALPSLDGYKAASARIALDPDQIDAYVRAVEERRDDQVKIALFLLLETGLRPSELCELRARHIQKTGFGCYIEVMGKSKSPRRVPLTGKRSTWLVNRAAAREGDAYLFEGREEGTHMAQGVLNCAVTGYWNRKKWYPGIADAIGEPRLTPYVLRHTYGTELRRKGGQLDDIAVLMGHENLETTRIYAKLGNDSLIELARKVAR